MTSTQSPPVTIGELLRRRRQEAELTQKELAKLLGYSDTIVSRVETGSQQPQPAYIEQIIKALQLDEAQQAELLAVFQQTGGVTSSPVAVRSRREDWGEAPDVSIFFGRQAELAELSQWLTVDGCRLVAVLGMGGIGKTTLVTKLAEQIKAEFDYVLWRSLRNAPPLADLLTDCLKFLSDQQRTDLPGEVSAQINLLIDTLRQKRCLLILDNLEAILQAETRTGEYREGYEAYGQLVQRLAQGRHQSCLVLTSREKPKELIPLAGTARPVRTLALPGLGQPDSRALLQDRELRGDESAWAALTQRYAGNPLALRQVSATIQELYGGEIITFLKEITTMFGEIRYLLEQQFNRLSKLEQDVMYWLAINREPVSISELREDLVQPVSIGELAEVMESLLRRSLIEKSASRFTLQNVIMEYITDRLIERVCEEIMLGTIHLFQSHALIKATAKEYIRESQKRLILKPIANKLVAALSTKGVEDQLKGILLTLRTGTLSKPGYAGGSIINLLLHLQSNLSSHDFSQLTIWQAYLQDEDLCDVNFVNADLSKSVFTETFGGLLSVAFSLNGALLAAGTTNGEIRLWEVANGQPFLTCKGHADWVRSIAFSPDGHTLASGSSDKTVRLWDISTGQCLKILNGHTSRVWSVAFSPDGHTLASGSRDETVRLWDTSTGQCLKILKDHTNRVWSVAFSPDGHFLASGSSDETVRLWDISTGQCLKTLKGHTNRIWSVAFSPNSRLIASGGGDQTIRLWDVSTGQCLKILQKHPHSILSVVFDPSGHILASGSSDQVIGLWDVSSGHLLRMLQGHTGQIWSVAINSDGRTLVSGSDDQTVRLWDISSGQSLKILQGYNNPVQSVALDRTSHWLASGNGDHRVRLWDVSTGRCLKNLQGHTHPVWPIAFNPEGEMLASGSRDLTIRLWKVSTGQCLTILHGHTYPVRSVAFSPDGKRLASSGDDRTIRLWDVNTGQCIKVMQHPDWVRSVIFNPNGSLLASGSFDQIVRLWDVNNGECLNTLQGHTHHVTSVAFNSEGTILASSSEDQSIRLWDVKSGQCFMMLQGHTHSVWKVLFSFKSGLLASCSSDQTVRLWDATTGECLKILWGHNSWVWSLAFSTHGDLLVSGDNNGKVKFWDIQAGQCLKTLRPDRPYERMNITGITGLTEAQKASLKALGAIDLNDPPTADH